jgi:sigma-B regulation protein RsbU (phosphoserine phosphatase)
MILRFQLTPIRLRTALIVPFAVQLVGAVGLVGYLSFHNGQEAVNKLAQELRQEVTNRIHQKLTDFLSIPHQINTINVGAVHQGRIQVQNIPTEQYLWNQIQAFPSVNSIYYGAEKNGGFVGVSRDEKGSLQVIINDETSGFFGFFYELNSQGNRGKQLKTVEKVYNARTRPWYTKAATLKVPIWSDLYVQFDSPILTISATRPVFDPQGQLLGVLGVDFSLQDIGQFLKKLRMGESGQTFIVERSGLLIASSGDESFMTQNQAGQDPKRIRATESKNSLVKGTALYLDEAFGNLNTIQTTQNIDFFLDGARNLVQIVPFQDPYGLDWLIVAVVPEKDFISQIEANSRTTLLLCIVALAVTMGLGLLTARWISRPILHLAQVSAAIAQGHLEQTVDPGSILEIQTLAHSFNSMVSQLKTSFSLLEDKVTERTQQLATANQEILALNKRLQAENTRLGSELEVARQIQQLILPKPEELGAIKGLEISGFMELTAEVGGDYYDVLETDGVVTIGIGDVVGHGLESGIVMLMTQTAVRTMKEVKEMDPVRFLDVLNRTLYQNIKRMNSDKNLTLVILNYKQGNLSISGQHEEVLVVRRGGLVERIDTLDLGFPIGLEFDIKDFITHTLIHLNPEDGVVLYTDGVTEAEDLQHHQYGLERLCQVISQHWSQSTDEIKQAVMADLQNHIGSQRVWDDITLLVIKRSKEESATGA